jgi:hypothetical protein
MMRYPPARQYLSFGIVAIGLAGFSAWLAMGWPLAFVPCVLFLLSGAVLIYLACRPAIELHPHHVSIGDRTIHWLDIRRIDRTGWMSPALIVRLTLFDDSRVLLIYPGNLDSCQALLRHLRRASRDALIDGVPYRQYWGEILSSSGPAGQIVGPRYRLLRTEDEIEVERLYQRLKTVGHLDQKSSSDEK